MAQKPFYLVPKHCCSFQCGTNWWSNIQAQSRLIIRWKNSSYYLHVNSPQSNTAIYCFMQHLWYNAWIKSWPFEECKHTKQLSHLKCTKLRVQIALVALFQLISALLNTRSVYVTITWLVRPANCAHTQSAFHVCGI